MFLEDCAYLNCETENPARDVETCAGCGRWLKRCLACGTGNRAFAEYCRSCRTRLPGWKNAWPSSKGGMRRLGVNEYPVPSPPHLKLQLIKELEMNGRCRYLLADEGHLFAFTMEGGITILDTYRKNAQPLLFRLEGKIYSEPVIYNGSLYVGTTTDEKQDRGTMAAFGLSGLSSAEPVLLNRWAIELRGIPTQALTAYGDRLYFKQVFTDTHREVRVVDGISKSKPKGSRMIYRGDHVTAPVVDPGSGNVYFLSSREGQLFLNTLNDMNTTSALANSDNDSGSEASGHTVETKTGVQPVAGVKRVLDAPADFQEHIGMAVMGDKIFAVFGQEGWLSCIDVRHCRFERRLYGQVKQFSLRNTNEMTNEMVILDASGVFFPLHNNRENFIPGESSICPVIMLGNRAVVIGLRDGKLRFYKPDTPSIQSEFRVFDSSGDEVTAMAAFRDKIAVGNQRGVVKLYQITKEN